MAWKTPRRGVLEERKLRPGESKQVREVLAELGARERTEVAADDDPLGERLVRSSASAKGHVRPSSACDSSQ